MIDLTQGLCFFTIRLSQSKRTYGNSTSLLFQQADLSNGKIYNFIFTQKMNVILDWEQLSTIVEPWLEQLDSDTINLNTTYRHRNNIQNYKLWRSLINQNNSPTNLYEYDTKCTGICMDMKWFKMTEILSNGHKCICHYDLVGILLTHLKTPS